MSDPAPAGHLPRQHRPVKPHRWNEVDLLTALLRLDQHAHDFQRCPRHSAKHGVEIRRLLAAISRQEQSVNLANMHNFVVPCAPNKLPAIINSSEHDSSSQFRSANVNITLSFVISHVTDCSTSQQQSWVIHFEFELTDVEHHLLIWD